MQDSRKSPPLTDIFMLILFVFKTFSGQPGNDTTSQRVKNKKNQNSINKSVNLFSSKYEKIYTTLRSNFLNQQVHFTFFKASRVEVPEIFNAERAVSEI